MLLKCGYVYIIYYYLFPCHMDKAIGIKIKIE